MSLTHSRTLKESTHDSYQVAKVVTQRGVDTGVKIYFVNDEINILEPKEEIFRDIEDDIEDDDIERRVSQLVNDSVQKLRIVGLNSNKLIHIENDILAREPSSDKYARRIYNDVIDIIDAEESKIFRVNPGYKLQLIPRAIPNINDRILYTGSSGSGKSYQATQYALNYLEQYPHNKIYLFSVKTEDPTIDSKISPDKLIRIKLDNVFVSEYMREEDHLNKYRDSLMWFDDIEQIDNDNVKKILIKVKATALQLGRQYEISIISIIHKGLGGILTQVEHCEASHYVIFPGKNLPEVTKILKTYCHYDKTRISRILDREGMIARWISIIRPNIVISENYVKIIK